MVFVFKNNLIYNSDRCFLKHNVVYVFFHIIKNSSKIFGWEEQYSLSKKYALRVLQNSYLYNRVYQEDIRKALPDIFKSKEDIKQIINPKLREIDEFNEEPLSKLTKDIFDWGILLNEDN